METIKEIFKLYTKGYRILSPSEFNEETSENFYYLVNKENLGANYVKKGDHIHLVSIAGYRIIKQNNISQYIG